MTEYFILKFALRISCQQKKKKITTMVDITTGKYRHDSKFLTQREMASCAVAMTFCSSY